MCTVGVYLLFSIAPEYVDVLERSIRVGFFFSVEHTILT
jgi:hypothetical protein